MIQNHKFYVFCGSNDIIRSRFNEMKLPEYQCITKGGFPKLLTCCTIPTNHIFKRRLILSQNHTKYLVIRDGYVGTLTFR